MTPSLMDETNIGESIEQGKKKDKEKETTQDNFPDLQARKKLKAEMIVLKSIFEELSTNDLSKEGYERYAVTDPFTGQDGKCRISWETWEMYFSNLENIKKNISGLKESKEYRDVEGVTHAITGEETAPERTERLDKLEEGLKESPVEDVEKKDLNEGRDKAEIIWDDKLENYESVDTEWLIEGMIPRGGIGVWTGNRATFKSFLVLNAAYCISNGLNFLGKYPTAKGKVIYLDKENGIPIMQRRSNMIKKGLKIEKGDVGFICFSQLMLDNLESIEEIEGIIEEHKPSLLVIDTYRRAIRFDENDAGNVSQLFVNILRPIVDKNRNLSIILIHHNRKGGGHGDKMDEIRGSSDLANYCDFILSNSRKGKNVVLEQLKNRNAPELEKIFVKIETDEESYITFEQGEGEVLKTKDQIATEELLLWITKGKLKEFGTGEWNLHATTKGIKKMSIHTSLSNLCDSGILEKPSMGRYKVIVDSQTTITK